MATSTFKTPALAIDETTTLEVAWLRIPNHKTAAFFSKFRAWNLDEIDITWSSQKQGFFGVTMKDLKIEGFSDQMAGVIRYFEASGIRIGTLSNRPN